MNHIGLPAGYELFKEIDFQNDKKFSRNIGISSIVCMLLIIAFGFIIDSLLQPDFTVAINIFSTIMIMVLALLGSIIYGMLHELTHGLFIKIFSGENAEYSFSIKYFSAGKKTAYFNKWAYLIIALSPVFIWGIVLVVLTIIVPPSWFWLPYVIQAFNLSGAMGDYYVTGVIIRCEKDVLVNDDGLSMRFYKKTLS